MADGKIVKPSGGKWPLGVALPSTIAQGTNGIAISKFCENRDVSPIHETVRRQDKEYWIYRFSKKEDADDFCKIFGGKLMQLHGPDLRLPRKGVPLHSPPTLADKRGWSTVDLDPDQGSV